jgi:hypothetical protein
VQVAQHLRLLEREVFYFGNAALNQTLAIALTGRVAETQDDLKPLEKTTQLLATLELQGTLHLVETGDLLAVTRFTKLLAVPKRSATVAQDGLRSVEWLRRGAR